MIDENLTAEQAGKILKLSTQTIWLMCKKGKLPAFKMPGSRKWLISSADLEKLQKELKKEQYGDK